MPNIKLQITYTKFKYRLYKTKSQLRMRNKQLWNLERLLAKLIRKFEGRDGIQLDVK